MQKAPVSDDLRHPYKFPYMTGKDALTRACSSLPVFLPCPPLLGGFRQLLNCNDILHLFTHKDPTIIRYGTSKLIEYRQMKMDISADQRYTDAVFYVLNRIKDKLLFDPEQKQVVDYELDCNIKSQPEPGFMGERKIIQKLQNESILTEIGEEIIIESGKKGTPGYGVSELHHFKVSKSFQDYYDRYLKIQNVTQNYCWFDNNTFFLTLRDDSVKAISFDTERGNRQVLALFQTIIEHWKKNGDKPITGSEIVKGMAKFGSIVETIQLKNIISNVRNKKIKPAGLEDKIHIKFDRKTSGWRVDIKR